VSGGEASFGGLCHNGHEVPAGATVCPTCRSPVEGATQTWLSPTRPTADFHPSNGSSPGAPPPSAPPASFGGWPPPDAAWATPGVQQATNGFALASLVLGILWVYWVGSILAVIFGYVALNQIRTRNEKGRGLAVAGLVFGCIGLAGLVAFLVAVALAH
jgi:hypothetical protein